MNALKVIAEYVENIDTNGHEHGLALSGGVQLLDETSIYISANGVVYFIHYMERDGVVQPTPVAIDNYDALTEEGVELGGMPMRMLDEDDVTMFSSWVGKEIPYYEKKLRALRDVDVTPATI